MRSVPNRGAQTPKRRPRRARVARAAAGPPWLRRLRRYVAPPDDDHFVLPPFTGRNVTYPVGPEPGDVEVVSIEVQDEFSEEVKTRWLEESDAYDAISYERWWFTYEMIRHAPRHWRKYAWWSERYEGPLTLEQRAALAYREEHLQEIPARWRDEIGDLDVPRGATFPPPTPGGTCPPGHDRWKHELLRLLACYARVPIRRSLAATHPGADDPPPPVGRRVLAYLDLELPDEEFKVSLQALREGMQVATRSAALNWSADEGFALKYVALLDHVCDGGSIPEFAKTWTRDHGGDPVIAADTFLDLAWKLLHVLRREPLAAIRGFSAPPPPRPKQGR